MGLGNDLIGDVEQLLTAQVLRKRALHRMRGPQSECWRAEQELAGLFPHAECLLLPSATVGLSLVLEVLDLRPGTEVLIAPFGWLSNWSCIVRAGLVPRFLPLDESLQLRVEDVLERMTPSTGAVIVTHLMGRGQQAVGAIAEACRERGIPLLEDLAQSFGVSVAGQRVGTFGLAAWCSLNHHKLLSAGDGGFVLSADPVYFERMCALHDQGNALRNGKRVPGVESRPGLSLRVSEITGAIVRAQLARFNWIQARVNRQHRLLSAALAGAGGFSTIPAHAGDIPFTVLFARHHEMQYPSLFDSGWHIAPHVPWLAPSFAAAAEEDHALARTAARLRAVSAVGAGFVDPYYAIPLGLTISDGPEAVAAVLAELRSR